MSAREPSAPPATPRRRPALSRDDVVTLLLALNLIGLVGLGARVYRGDRPTVVTVGITQMAREYTARLATSRVSADEARIRTQLFLAVAQDAVKQAASRKGIIVVPRECILAGEYTDMTAEVTKAVNATLEQRRGAPALPTAPLALPSAGGADGP